MTCEGEALKEAFDFTYLGFGASTDGDNLTPMNANLIQLAASRYNSMGNIWRSSEIRAPDIEAEDLSSRSHLELVCVQTQNSVHVI